MFIEFHDASRMGKTCSPDPLLASAERIEIVNGPALLSNWIGGKAREIGRKGLP
jgi:hypothetical protein